MVLRPMAEADVDSVLDVQQPGAVRALADIFPQDQYPFPYDQLRERWKREINAPDIACYVIQQDDRVAGFAAVRSGEFLHFGTAVDTWGSGLAGEAHDEVLISLINTGIEHAYLRVFEANGRARRFYEKHGWVADGQRSNSTFPPYPTLLRYTLDLAEHTSLPR